MKFASIIAACLAALTCRSAIAEDAAFLSSGSIEPALRMAATDDDSWRFTAIGWLWLTSMDGDVGARGIVTSVDATFSDFVEESDTLFALAGRIELGQGRWSGFVDGTYSTMSFEDVSGPIGFSSLDVKFDSAIVDFGVIYRLAEWECEAGASNRTASNIALDVYGGGRYQMLDLEIDPANFPSQSQDKDWIDPIVGGRLTLPMSDQWHFATWADIGGFGVSSDITWSATGVFGYDFQMFDWPATVYAGYRATGTDYSSGSDADEFVWDVILHGPIIGFAIQF